MATHEVPGEHIYQGITLPGLVADSAIEKIRDCDMMIEGDVLIAGYPKTGNQWMQNLVALIFCDGDKDKAHDNKPQEERVIHLEMPAQNTTAGIELLKTCSRPSVMGSHLQIEILRKQILEGRLKVIVIIRNPKDTLVSYYNFYKMNQACGNYTGTWDEFFELYKAKRLIFGDYFEWYGSLLPYLDSQNVLLVRYEDMKKRMPKVIKSLGEFIGKDLEEDVIEKIDKYTSFDYMKKDKLTNFSGIPILRQDISPFHRKGIVGDWKNYFTESQSSLVDEAYDQRMKNVIELEFE